MLGGFHTAWACGCHWLNIFSSSHIFCFFFYSFFLCIVELHWWRGQFWSYAFSDSTCTNQQTRVLPAVKIKMFTNMIAMLGCLFAGLGELIAAGLFWSDGGGGGGGVNEWLKQNPVWLQRRILLKEACSCSPTAMVSSEWTGHRVWRCCKAPESISLTRTCVNFRPQGKKLCTRPGLWWFYFIFYKLQRPKNKRIRETKENSQKLVTALRDNKKRTKLQILPRTTVIHFYFGVDLISVQAFFT